MTPLNLSVSAWPTEPLSGYYDDGLLVVKVGGLPANIDLFPDVDDLAAWLMDSAAALLALAEQVDRSAVPS